jgi:hypothetical protein
MLLQKLLVGFTCQLRFHSCQKKCDETLISFLSLAALLRPNRISSIIRHPFPFGRCCHPPPFARWDETKSEMNCLSFRWREWKREKLLESSEPESSVDERKVNYRTDFSCSHSTTSAAWFLFVSFSALPFSQPDKWVLDVWMGQTANELIKSKCGATHTHFPRVFGFRGFYLSWVKKNYCYLCKLGEWTLLGVWRA